MIRAMTRGMVRGAVRGLLPRPSVAGGIVYPASGAEWASMAGFAGALTNYWRFTRADAGVELDIEGSADLSPVGTPTQGVFDADLNSVCLQFPDAANRRMAAADSSVLEVGASDFLYWEVCRAPVVTDVNLRAIASKRSADAGNAGWDLFGEFDARVRLTIDGGVNLNNADADEAWSTTTVRIITAVCDRNANSARVHVWHDGAVFSGTGVAITAADLTGTGVFGVGNSVAAGAASLPRFVSAAGMIIGTGARGFGALNLSTLAVAMRVP
jgi:hypothetical protein